MSGQSACAEIQKHKDDLIAQAQIDKTTISGIIANLSNNMTSWMNPESYTAKNQTESTILNILRTSINQERAINISQACSTGASKAQTNVIDNLSCAICNGGVIYEDVPGSNNKKYVGVLPAENIKLLKGDAGDPCVLTNITQRNKSETEQKCKMNSIITDVMKAQSDTQAQGVLRALQEASGLLSSNSSKSFSCNDVKTELTQKDYLGYVASCASSISSVQSNLIQHCGKANNVIQENIIQSIQDCVNSNTVTKEMDAVSKTSAAAVVETTQTAKGLNLDFMSFLASTGASQIIIIIIVIIVIIVICCISVFLAM